MEHKEGGGTYRLADFIYRLEQEGMGLLDMQSDEALELVNECLPKNMLIARAYRTSSQDNLEDTSL